MLYFENYLTPVLVFGGAIGVDVLITTISRFKDKGLTFINWALFLGFTHAVFPAISYFTFWGATTASPGLYSVLGILGFLFITAVVYEILCEALGTEPRFSLTHLLSHFFGVDRNKTRHFAIVLSVSWDALLCGPGLLPMAKAGSWSVPMMIGAFLIFGLIVGLVGIISLHFANKLREKNFSDTKKLARLNLIGTFCELSIIGGFGVNSLWSAFSFDSNVYLSIFATSYLMLVIFIKNAPALWHEAKKEALESVSN